MKSSLLKIICVLMLFAACKKNFLDTDPQGVVTEDVLANKNGVAQLLVSTYHDVTGLTIHSGWWSTTGVNWVYGDITAGDAYRGGGSDGGDGELIEEFKESSTTGYFQDKWNAVYDGVSRSNTVIRAANKAPDMTDAEKAEAIGEARFLRGHFHFEAKKMWNNVPYIDENVVTQNDYKALSNDKDIWPQIVADFRFAYNNLPEHQDLKGKANKWAAACYIVKCYMFMKDYNNAKALLDSIIPAAYGGNGNGKNSQGVPYALTKNFDDNFNGATENNSEQVFQIQFSVNDGSNGGNENIGESPNTPAFYPLSSFYTTWKQPSFNFVNAFKTDASGLPMPDDFNNENMTNDQDIAGDDYTYYPYQETVDPRLDWTVGRRAVPYLNWTDQYLDANYTVYNNYWVGYPSNPGSDPNFGWINDRDFGGPYTPVKNNYRADQVGIFADNYASGYLLGSGVNYSIIRFADVLLWAAECEVEGGSLNRARELVNYVRARARDGRYVNVVYDYEGSYYASANYYIDTYNAPWTSQDEARKAVRFERRLELGLEGHRFFDLVRWGIAADYINNYLSVEKTRLTHLNGASFIAGKNEYYPIPQQEVDLSNSNGAPLIKQNPGY